MLVGHCEGLKCQHREVNWGTKTSSLIPKKFDDLFSKLLGLGAGNVMLGWM